MSDQIKHVFEQYHQSFLSAVNSDDFFTFLMNSINSGDNEMSFLMKKLNKNIDMRWVEMLEDCIIPLDTIIRNPRRFIVQEDEVVPIHLSKKVTPDSVRHLSQHTHYISQIRGEEVQPNKILNVSREDTIDIYENRFIYTLLQKLRTFMEKRYNVLFANMDDEEMAHIVMKGQFHPQQGETVEYSIDLSTVTRPYMGGDELNPRHMAPLARIDRINQYLQSFMYTSFYKEMRGCALVRPPIMRTNVIMKEPNFKKCLALWQFIEAYDEIGYTIESYSTQQLPEQRSLAAIYSGLALQYVFLKQSADQTLETTSQKKQRPKQFHPKFVHSVVEEIVRDFNISETEVHRVFLDEIAKVNDRKEKERQQVVDAINAALLWDKNRRLKIEEAIRLEKQREREKERERILKEKLRIEREKEKARLKRERERERIRKAKEKALAVEKARKEKERLAKERAKERERLAKEQAIAREKERIAKEKERARIAKEQAIAAEKARVAREKERARIAKEKAEALEKERAAKAREKERERIAREKAEAAEKERIAKEKAKERARIAKEKADALEKERAAKAREKERERIAKEKAEAAEKERLAKERAKEKARLAKEKADALEKERAAKAREKERERVAREKAKAAEQERIAKEKAKEKARLAKEKAAALEKERAAKAREREKARLAAAKEKAKEKERLAKEKAKLEREKAIAREKERIARDRQKAKNQAPTDSE